MTQSNPSYKSFSWQVYACYKGEGPNGEPIEMSTFISPLAITFDGKPLDPKKLRLTGFSIRDSQSKNGNYEEIEIKTRKAANDPERDLVSPQQAAGLAGFVVGLLRDVPAKLERAANELEWAKKERADFITGIEAFYGDADHVPMGIATLYLDHGDDY